MKAAFLRLPALALALFGCILGAQTPAPAALPAPAKPASGTLDAEGWRSMFDGKSLDGWKEVGFVGRGKVTVRDGAIILGNGFMTGVNWTAPFPKSNYEVRWEASRLEGSDFFCGLTFPAKGSYISWISGGWGGNLIGLSSLDGMDASENETTTFMNFEKGRWYSFRLRVTDDWIEGWIDNQQVIGTQITNRQVGLRFGEIENSVPFGFASYSTTGALRKIEYRTLEKEPVSGAPEKQPN